VPRAGQTAPRSKPTGGRYRASHGWHGRVATRHSRSAPSVRPVLAPDFKRYP
jgi:hypothetical protein